MKEKKINTKAKGRRNELKAKKQLEEEGFQVIIAPRSTRKFEKGEHDLFGLWDLIACNKDIIRFIQVKSNRKPYGKLRAKYAAFECPEECPKELWIYYDRVKEPEIILI